MMAPQLSKRQETTVKYFYILKKSFHDPCEVVTTALPYVIPGRVMVPLLILISVWKPKKSLMNE